MSIGLIGYGRFGKLAARLIARRAHVLVYDRTKSRFPSRKIRACCLAEVASQPIVILAVPISSLQQTLHSLAPLLHPRTLVVDVCSVKAKPVEWMKRILPKHVSILGAHPLFGPDSVGRSLRGCTVVLCPVRISRYILNRVIRVLEQPGIDVRIMTPQAHDRMMAETLLLSHYIGRLVSGMKLHYWQDGAASYRKLMEVVNATENDSVKLFKDMWEYNPYSKLLRRKIERSRRGLL